MYRRPLASFIVAAALAACGSTSKSTKGPDPEPADTSVGAPDIAPPPPDTTPPPPDPEQVKAALIASELSAYNSAKPVLQTSCGTCHQQGGIRATPKKLEHLDISAYPFKSHHLVTLTATFRHVMGIDGAKPSMPRDKPGSVQGADLGLIEAWANAFDAAESGGAHLGLPGYAQPGDVELPDND